MPVIDKTSLKRRLYSGETCLGTWVFMPSPDIMEIVGLAGWDFAVIDMEHSAVTLQDAVAMIRGAECRGLVPLLRVSWENKSHILRGLDSGAHGIHLPHIETADDVREAVRLARYFPQGGRGISTNTRGGGYQLAGAAEHVRTANDGVLLTISLESQESFANFPAMLEVPGFDVVFVGPYDLSQSLGRPGEIDHPEVLKKMETIIARIRKGGKIPGSFARTAQRARQLKDMGVQYLTCESAESLMRTAYENLREEVTAPAAQNKEKTVHEPDRRKQARSKVRA